MEKRAFVSQMECYLKLLSKLKQCTHWKGYFQSGGKSGNWYPLAVVLFTPVEKPKNTLKFEWVCSDISIFLQDRLYIGFWTDASPQVIR